MPPQPQPLIFYASIMEVHVRPSRGGRLVYVSDINEVMIKLSNGATGVDTFGADNKRGGLGGFAKGPVHNMLTFKSATRVEQTELEFDWISAVQEHMLLTVQGYIVGDQSGKRRKYEGMPMSLDESFGLGKPSMADIQIHCGRASLIR
jgi:hypothetical protein